MQSCLPDDDGTVSPVLKQLTKQPPIITRIDGLLSPAECDFLIQKAQEAGYQRSETEGRGRISAHRTSSTAYLPLDDKVVACIGERLATFAGMPADSLEQLQATRYGTDEQYRRHHDDDAAGGSKGHQRRLKTIFAYLHASGICPRGNALVLLTSTSCISGMGSPCACTRAPEARSCGATGVTLASATCGRAMGGRK